MPCYRYLLSNGVGLYLHFSVCHWYSDFNHNDFQSFILAFRAIIKDAKKEESSKKGNFNPIFSLLFSFYLTFFKKTTFALSFSMR